MVGFGGHHLAASNSWAELDQMALDCLKRSLLDLDLLQRLCRSLRSSYLASYGCMTWGLAMASKRQKDLTEGVLFNQWVLLIDCLAR